MKTKTLLTIIVVLMIGLVSFLATAMPWGGGLGQAGEEEERQLGACPENDGSCDPPEDRYKCTTVSGAECGFSCTGDDGNGDWTLIATCKDTNCNADDCPLCCS